MHLLQRAVLLICALTHGIANQEVIFDQIGFRFAKVGDTLPKFMDTNCDGMVDQGELLTGMANILSRDPVHMHDEWEQLEYKDQQYPVCVGHGPNNSFLIFGLSAAYMHFGRIDQRPCLLLHFMVPLLASFGFDAPTYLKGAMILADMRRFFKHFHTLAPGMENVIFQKRLDVNADGCLSEEEWKSDIQSEINETRENFGFHHRIVAEFSTIEEYRPPKDFGFVSMIRPFYEETCVTALRFTVWTLFSLLSTFEKANETAPCYKEVDQTNVSLELSVQLKLEPSDQKQWSMEWAVILVGIFGGSGIMCLGICIIWCYCKHQRKDHLDLREKHVFMETEIEAWSVFDRNLTARTSSLKPSFVQILGLGNFKEDQLSFTQIVHPDDHSILHATLTQVNSEPITKEVRFQYGFSRVLTGEGVLLQDDVKYISVQTTLVLSSKSSIHVGLKSLSRNGPCISTIVDPALLGYQEAQMPDKERGNDQTQDTSEVVTETVFNTADLQQIASLGLEEHWLIAAENITFDITTQKTGGFGKVQHGFLLGSAEVAVKMALTNERGEQLACKCKVLANEVRLFRRIRHPNIVQFHGVVFISRPEGHLGIVLEWVNGGNLGQHFKTQHSTAAYDVNTLKTAEGQVIAMSDFGLLLDVVKGMLYLHALRPVILHRDLKPANILVDKACVPLRAKLTDFGLSILIEHDEHAQKRAGTEAYMAPEVKSGQPYSTMVDVFSFGCVIAFALTGYHPNKNLDNLVLPQDLFEDFGDCLIIKRCQDSLVSAACQCLNPDPTLRPTFADVFTLLSKHLHDARSNTTLSVNSGDDEGDDTMKRSL